MKVSDAPSPWRTPCVIPRLLIVPVQHKHIDKSACVVQLEHPYFSAAVGHDPAG